MFITIQTYSDFVGSFEALISNPSWKYLPSRWNKAYREAEDNFNSFLDFGVKIEAEARNRLKSNPTENLDEMSVLEKMIKRNAPGSTYPLVMALDLIFAGIDTTGNTLGFLMYHLATNPDKQEILRKECQKLGNNLASKDLNELRYLKACIQETNRLSPTVAVLIREISTEFTLHGYEIPKDTVVFWSPFLFSEQFPDADKFIPERWIEDKKEICPFSVRQFSHGPRMCIGKRFADLELQLFTHKLMTNFKINWVNPEPMTVSQLLVDVPDQSLDFQFQDL